MPIELLETRLKIVVVDGDKTSLDHFRRMFRPLADQVELVATSSGVEALLLVAESRPHGLVIDLELPDIDGLEVCRRIRARKHLALTRLVTMSRRPSTRTTESSRAVGASACLAKPVPLGRLLEVLPVPSFTPSWVA